MEGVPAGPQVKCFPTAYFLAFVPITLESPGFPTALFGFAVAYPAAAEEVETFAAVLDILDRENAVVCR